MEVVKRWWWHFTMQGRLRNVNKLILFTYRKKVGWLNSFINCHNETGRGWTFHTLAQLWKQYWISQRRSVVNKAFKECLTCRRWHHNRSACCKCHNIQKQESTDPDWSSSWFRFIWIRKCWSRSYALKKWIHLLTYSSTHTAHPELISELSAEAVGLSLTICRPQRNRRSNSNDNACSSSWCKRRVQDFVRVEWSSGRSTADQTPWQGGV